MCVCVCLPCSSDVKGDLEIEITEGIKMWLTCVEKNFSAASRLLFNIFIKSENANDSSSNLISQQQLGGLELQRLVD